MMDNNVTSKKIIKIIFFKYNRYVYFLYLYVFMYLFILVVVVVAAVVLLQGESHK